jgi:hypothetical protein
LMQKNVHTNYSLAELLEVRQTAVGHVVYSVADIGDVVTLSRDRNDWGQL